MKREKVESSVIAAVGYDADLKVLELKFTSGACYRYTQVDELLHARLMTAPSLGRFFDREIRDLKPSEQIG
ncbi:KTSC domain-containing protein [Luteibacter yeojuensis]|uniref:KTSC domain-containing protein n=1 Tax=Luteibacter yeojuensis TaxID=345309 RepID=A0A0F3KU41_9GAMM|nr:KTSC domain-containing protein [Luteibacter yeojuensis]KJV34733.1 hypothetical protein VI08_09035 [Luteibacter yeojuensis]